MSEDMSEDVLRHVLHETRHRRMKALATELRRRLECAGVLLVVDWGDGHKTAWTHCTEESVLNELYDGFTEALRRSGKLEHSTDESKGEATGGSVPSA